ncbi:UNVERIFIED_ORG: hypothetical protein LHK14_17995 [Roseateles sp. XES5]|nr:hypothetical protein [Roseateles sp. XES5]
MVHISAGSDFPPSGYTVSDTTFGGLAAAGFLEAVEEGLLPEEEALNRRLIVAIDKRMSAMSDEDLKALIARRGTPFSGNMVHAVLVAEAKAQLLREYEGAEPVAFVNPNAGVTEQPLSAPGQATPPSAAAAVEQQKAQQEASQQQQEANMQNGGENKATNQFGEPLPAGAGKLTRGELAKLNKADLEAYAAKHEVDLTGAKTKDEFLDAIAGKY